MTNAGDPVGSKLITSLARPGGNITGLSMLNVELGGKRLDILKEVVPKLSTVFLLWNPANHGNLLIKNNTEMIARSMTIRVQSVEIKTGNELEKNLDKLATKPGSAMIVVEDPTTVDGRVRLAEVAAKKSLPAIYGLSQYADAGGLLSYGIHLEDLFRRAATYVDKILKGSKPADIPVEQPTKFEFVINLKAAKQIGLTIPPNVLVRANRVIR